MWICYSPLAKSERGNHGFQDWAILLSKHRALNPVVSAILCLSPCHGTAGWPSPYGGGTGPEEGLASRRFPRCPPAACHAEQRFGRALGSSPAVGAGDEGTLQLADPLGSPCCDQPLLLAVGVRGHLLLRLRPSRVFVQLPPLAGQRCSLAGWALPPWCSKTWCKPPSKNGAGVPVTGVACRKHQLIADVCCLSWCQAPASGRWNCHRPVLICPKLVKCVGFTQCNSDSSLFWSIPGRFFCFSARWLQCRPLKFGAGQPPKHRSGWIFFFGHTGGRRFLSNMQ